MLINRIATGLNFLLIVSIAACGSSKDSSGDEANETLNADEVFMIMIMGASRRPSKKLMPMASQTKPHWFLRCST
ncbi:MAG: hypothetical protein ACI8W3_002877 [Myxococcota bacterium]|jgi:hypothetical protein